MNEQRWREVVAAKETELGVLRRENQQLERIVMAANGLAPCPNCAHLADRLTEDEP